MIFSPDTLTELTAWITAHEANAAEYRKLAERAQRQAAQHAATAETEAGRAAEYRALLAFAESHPQQPVPQPVPGDVLVAGTPAPPAPAPEAAEVTSAWCRCGDDTRPGGHAFSACHPLDQPRVRGPFEAATSQAPDTPETGR